MKTETQLNIPGFEPDEQPKPQRKTCCMVCNRPLKTEKSVLMGIGPKCLKMAVKALKERS